MVDSGPKRRKRRAKPGTDLVATRNRENKALELRLAGLSYVQIGEQLGVTKQAANKMVARRLDEFAPENAAELRKLEAARLDQLQARARVEGQGGDLKAMQLELNVMASRAKLFGLNAPETVMVHQGLERILVVVREVVTHEQFEEIALRLAPGGATIEATAEPAEAPAAAG